MQRIVLSFFFLSVLLPACMRELNVNGSYSLSRSADLSYHNMILYSDSTFKFYWNYHLAADVAWGKYSQVGEKVFFNYSPNKSDTIQGEYKFKYVVSRKQGIVVLEARVDTISRPYYYKNPFADRRPKEAIYKNGKLIIQKSNSQIVLYKAKES